MIQPKFATSERNIEVTCIIKQGVSKIMFETPFICLNLRWIYLPNSSAVFFMRSAIFTPNGQRDSQPRQPMQSPARCFWER